MYKRHEICHQGGDYVRFFFSLLLCFLLESMRDRASSGRDALIIRLLCSRQRRSVSQGLLDRGGIICEGPRIPAAGIVLEERDKKTAVRSPTRLGLPLVRSLADSNTTTVTNSPCTLLPAAPDEKNGDTQKAESARAGNNLSSRDAVHGVNRIPVSRAV